MMKLLRCHIENFGTLQDQDYDFTDGLNQFYHENGYGKSTLAAFFKAMFFGLPSYKNNTTTFNDRMHYYPFNGGKFGGSLTFEMKGKEYRIERFFDKKSDTGDELTVYCDGNLYDGFHGEIGKAVFGLDKESFERTAFFTETDADLCATNAIGEKLNKFVERTDDVGYKEAIGALEKAKKDLKKKGEGGRINVAQEKISSLSREIDNLEKISDSLPSHYSRQRTLQEEIGVLQGKIKAAGGENLVVEKWKTLEALTARQEKLTAAAAKLREQYPSGMPTVEELARVKKEMENVNTIRELKTRYTFPDSKIDKLQRYERVFGHTMPTDDVLADVGAQADEIKRIEAELALTAPGEDERLQRLEQKFAAGLPSEKKIHEISERVDEYRKLHKSTPINATIAPKKKHPLYIVLAVVAVAIALAGVGLLFVNAMIGGVLIGVGVLSLGVVGFLYLKGQSAPVQSAENAQHLAKLQALESAVREFLVPYGYYSQNGIVFDFGSFEQDRQEYLEKSDSRHNALSRADALKRRHASLKRELRQFFEEYEIDVEDFQLALVALKSDLASFAALQAEEKEFYEKQEASQREVVQSLEAVKKIYEKYALHAAPSLEHIEDMLAELTELTRLEREAAALGREAEAYRKENKLTEKPQAVETDVTPLNAELNEKQRELAALQRQIADAEADAERLDDKRSQKEAAQEELARLEERLAVITAALDSLQEADRNLKNKYVTPVKNTFLKYAAAIEAALGDRMSMGENFRITFERGSERRSDKYLSAGQRSVCALGFRLALIENMFESEQPFLVLDDPFASLDEVHFEKTAALVKSLADNMQILYFCCHKSRKI